MERKGLSPLFIIFSAVALFSEIRKRKKLLPVKLLLIFIIIPMIGYIFFQGNFGNIYDYYMTGYYFPMVLLFSLGLGIIWRNLLGKIIVICFVVFFIIINVSSIKNYLSAGVDGPHHITLGNELQAVNWIFDDSQGLKEFKVDVYVPPVIPHSYDYLFLWQGNNRCGDKLCGLVREGEVNVLYTLFEIDPPHPNRLDNWLSRFDGWTKVEQGKEFGGITVERRIIL
jgi:hypothetical protein